MGCERAQHAPKCAQLLAMFGGAVTLRSIFASVSSFYRANPKLDTYTHTITHTPSQTHHCTHTYIITRTHTRTLHHTHTHIHTITHTHTLPQTHTITHQHTHTFTHRHTALHTHTFTQHHTLTFLYIHTHYPTHHPTQLFSLFMADCTTVQHRRWSFVAHCMMEVKMWRTLRGSISGGSCSEARERRPGCTRRVAMVQREQRRMARLLGLDASVFWGVGCGRIGARYRAEGRVDVLQNWAGAHFLGGRARQCGCVREL